MQPNIVRTESGFKAGRQDIMRSLAMPEAKPANYVDEINKAYLAEQRYGFYTAWADFAHVRQVYKGTLATIYIAKCRFSRGKLILKAYWLSQMSQAAQKSLKSRLGFLHEIMAPDNMAYSSNDIVRSFGFFEERGQIIFVMEYCARGDVMSYMRGRQLMEANVVIEIIQPVLRALQHLHKKNLVHGNINPENVLLTVDGYVKVADFDCTSKSNEKGEVVTQRMQTPSLEYMAPELVRYHFPAFRQPGEYFNKKLNPYTPATDIWALGCMVYELINGMVPFMSTDDSNGKDQAINTARQILQDDVYVGIMSHMSDEALSFVRFAMQKDPARRPSVEELMLHPWIQNFAAIEITTMFDQPAPDFDSFAREAQFRSRSIQGRSPFRKLATKLKATVGQLFTSKMEIEGRDDAGISFSRRTGPGAQAAEKGSNLHEKRRTLGGAQTGGQMMDALLGLQ